ncbi:MAG: hypothetical protein H6624_10930 [Bdellovibrionaceae bacterium]|nr:hypothetical protein [Bdellovibrionales bacterium]MCB9084851.1 hypothetical protein [Pseudobdellovibrionaceae bacterium]
MAAKNFLRLYPFLILSAFGVLGLASQGEPADAKCLQEKLDYDLVFQGRIGFPVTIMDSPSMKSSTKPDEAYENVGFYETKIWKGEARPQGPYNAIPIRTGVKDSYKFPKSDDTYLVHATKMKDGSYFVHRCSPTLLLKDAKRSTKMLGRPIYEERYPYYKNYDLNVVLKKYRSTNSEDSFDNYWRSYVDRYRSETYRLSPCSAATPGEAVFIGRIFNVSITEGKRPGKLNASRFRFPFYPWKMVNWIMFDKIEIYLDLEKQLHNSVVKRSIERRHLSGSVDPWEQPVVVLRELDANSYEFAEVSSKYYLIRGSWRESGELYVDRCSGTKPIEEVKETELRALGKAIFKAKDCYTCAKRNEGSGTSKGR